MFKQISLKRIVWEIKNFNFLYEKFELPALYHPYIFLQMWMNKYSRVFYIQIHQILALTLISLAKNFLNVTFAYTRLKEELSKQKLSEISSKTEWVRQKNVERR